MYTHRELQEHNTRINKKYNAAYIADKGHINLPTASNTDIKIAFANEAKALAKRDYILKETYDINGITIGVFYNKSVNSTKYSTGAMSLVNPKAKDANITSINKLIQGKEEREAIRKHYQSTANAEGVRLLDGIEPKIKEGTTILAADHNGVNLNQMADLAFITKTDDSNAYNTNAGEIIGNTLSHNVIINTAPDFNKKLGEVIIDDYDENYKKHPEDFIKVTKSNADITYGSKKQQESMDAMPFALYKQLESHFGEDRPFYVRRSTFNTAFGFKKMTLSKSSLFNKRSNSTKKLVFHIESIWQAVVAKSKTNSILYNPRVLAVNTVSNSVLLATLGISPDSIFRYQKEALVSAVKYRMLIKKKADLERKVKAFRKYKGRDRDLAQINRYEAEIESSPVHDIVSDGLLQGVVEDVATTVTPLANSIDDTVKAYSSTGEGYVLKAIDNITKTNSKLPISPVDVVKNVAITDDTALASALRDATQYSDFIARYALIKHRMGEGVKREDAINEALDAFIDYEIQTNPVLQYINDVGLLQYTKFFFRIQKVIFRQFKEKPINSLAVLLAQKMLMDVSDIADSNLLHGAYSPSVTDVIDTAFDLNLLKYLPI
jgi:hypothetical protein